MNDEPIVFLRRIHSERSAIRLLNVYKGLPISNEAKITSIDASSIVVNSIKAQIVCMFLDRETYIQSPDQPATIKASVLGFNPAQMEARLGNLQYVHGSIGERRAVRVAPVEAINSLVQPKKLGGSIKAELADISHSGLAIYISRRVFMPDIFKVGAEMVVNLTLPVTSNDLSRNFHSSSQGSELISRFDRENIRGVSSIMSAGQVDSDSKRERRVQSDNKSILVRAQVMNVKVEIPNDRARIGMRMFINADSQAVISSFISQRQAELVREVKSLYDLLNKFDL